MNRNGVVVVVVVLAVALMLAAGQYLARPQLAEGNRLVGDVKGMPAPEFELESLDGRKVKLSDYRGKAVLLNFWATWCAPCKVEMPWFAELQKQYGPQGLEVIGIAMDDASNETIAKFVKDVGADYTILLGKEAVGDAYGGVQFLPTTFFIDRSGFITERLFGLKSLSDFESRVKTVLASAAPAAEEHPHGDHADTKQPAQGVQ